MRATDIQIHTGDVAVPYKRIAEIEAKVLGGSLLSNAPTIEEVNAELQLKAADIYANAVIEVEYSRGMSFTSYKVLKARGLAVILERDEVDCPFCAEPVKRAARKCKHCASDLAPATR